MKVLSLNVILYLLLMPGMATYSATPAITDTVTINGKFTSPCNIPSTVRLSKYNVGDLTSYGAVILIGKDGTFSYQIAINAAQQVTIGISKIKFEVLLAPSEKRYTVEIGCENNEPAKVRVKDSYENHAYTQLNYTSKYLSDSLKEIINANTVTGEKFNTIKNLFANYQRQVSAIKTSYPRSYTGQVLCQAVLLPDSAFSSFAKMKDVFMQRATLSNPEFYSTNFLANRILADYLLLVGTDDTNFTGFGKALDIACKNPEAGKLFEQLLYTTFTSQHKEHLIRGFAEWSAAHHDKMYNMVVREQLKLLGGCVAGAPFIDVTFNDPNGVPRKLSETVASAKLTLLIFYSPMCSHCQETLPKILPVWNQYKNKGLKIYAVGDNANNDQWNDFIKTKGTGEWTNVYKNDTDPGASTKYMITTIPVMILIDEHGKIITRFADLDYLNTEIPKYFAR